MTLKPTDTRRIAEMDARELRAAQDLLALRLVQETTKHKVQTLIGPLLERIGRALNAARLNQHEGAFLLQISTREPLPYVVAALHDNLRLVMMAQRYHSKALVELVPKARNDGLPDEAYVQVTPLEVLVGAPQKPKPFGARLDEMEAAMRHFVKKHGRQPTKGDDPLGEMREDEAQRKHDAARLDEALKDLSDTLAQRKDDPYATPLFDEATVNHMLNMAQATAAKAPGSDVPLSLLIDRGTVSFNAAIERILKEDKSLLLEKPPGMPGDI